MADKRTRAKLRTPENQQVTKVMCEQAEKLCKLGLTDAELADFFGVTPKTIQRWYLDVLMFRQSVDEGRLFQTARVADKLYHRAMGYDYLEEKTHVIDGVVHRVTVQKHAVPDVTAQMKILESRRPQDWGKREVRELVGAGGRALEVPAVRPEDLSREELELFRLMLEKRIAAASGREGQPAALSGPPGENP